jgi:hypothetical protein
VAANDLGDIATMAHLLKYDTVLGTLAEDVSVSGDTIRVGDKSIKILAERDPAAAAVARPRRGRRDRVHRPVHHRPAAKATSRRARRRSSSPRRPRKRTSRS